MQSAQHAGNSASLSKKADGVIICSSNVDVKEEGYSGSVVSSTKSHSGPFGHDTPHPGRDSHDMSVPTEPLHDGEDEERRGVYAQRSRNPTLNVNGKGRGLALANSQTIDVSHCHNDSGKRFKGKETRGGRINKINLTNVSTPEASQFNVVSSQLHMDITGKCVPTEPVFERENVRVEGRIAQYSQCLNLKSIGKGRGNSLADARTSKVSRNHSPLVHASVRACYLKNGDSPMKHSSNAYRREESEHGCEKSIVNVVKKQRGDDEGSPSNEGSSMIRPHLLVPLEESSAAMVAPLRKKARSTAESTAVKFPWSNPAINKGSKAKAGASAKKESVNVNQPMLSWEDANGEAPGSTTRTIMREHELRKRPLIWEEFDEFTTRRMTKRKNKKKRSNPSQNASLEWEDANGKWITQQSTDQRMMTAGERSLSPAPPLSQSPSDVAQLGRRPPPPPPPPPHTLQPAAGSRNEDEFADLPGLCEVKPSEDDYSDFSSEDSSSSDEEETSRDRERIFRETLERVKSRRRGPPPPIQDRKK